jgi:antitoxin component of MazEF toxin-antitoxin module
METITCIAKKWGGSVGGRIPAEVVKKEGLIAAKPILVGIEKA